MRTHHASGPLQWGPKLVGMGMAVCRLHPRKKTPVGDGWQTRATTRAEDIPLVFDPDDNIGVVLGRQSGGLVDADHDCPEALRLTRLLPATDCAWGRAGVGMTHRLYRCPEALAGRPGAEETYHDLAGNRIFEVRWGYARQTMAPGSIHPDGDFIITAAPELPPPASVPLADVLAAARRIAATIALARVWPGKSRRNEFAVAAAGGLVLLGLDVEAAEQILLLAARLAGDEQAAERAREARRAFEKVAAGDRVVGFPTVERDFDLPKLGKLLRDNLRITTPPYRGSDEDQPRSRPQRTVAGGAGNDRGRFAPQPAPRSSGVVLERAYVPFPYHLFPAPVRDMIDEVSPARNVDPAMIALPAMTAMAGLVGCTHQITPNGDWFQYPILWTALICETGSRKSAGFEVSTAWLNRREKVYRDIHREAMDQYRVELDQWKDTPARERGDRPREPAPRVRLYTADATLEVLPRIMEGNPRGLSYLAEELVGFFNRLIQYSGNNTSFFLQFFDGGAWNRDRVGEDKGSQYVERACLSICGTIQPQIFADLLTAQAVLSGLIPRFLLAMPDPRLNLFQGRLGRLRSRDRWEQLQADLHGLTFDSDNQPRTVTLSPAAVDRWEQWHNAHAHLVFNAVAGAIKGADAKMWGQGLRLCLLLHLAECLTRGRDPQTPVSLETVEAALGLTEWFSAEASRIYSYLQLAGPQLVETLEERILRYFRRRPDVETASVRDLVAALRGREKGLTAPMVGEALETLVRGGFGSIEPTESGRSTVFRVNRSALNNTPENDPEEVP